MLIEIDKNPFSSLTFYKGQLKTDSEIKLFQICLDINESEKRKKINFYADGAKFTEIEKTDILMVFNEQILSLKINDNTIEE